MANPLAWPPVNTTLPELRFVNVPAVPAIAVAPDILPPVNTALPELKFVATAVVLDNAVLDKLVRLPVVAFNVAVLTVPAFVVAPLTSVAVTLATPEM